MNSFITGLSHLSLLYNKYEYSSMSIPSVSSPVSSPVCRYFETANSGRNEPERTEISASVSERKAA
jgi:hypothetical protein